MLYQAIILPESGNVNLFWLLSEFITDPEQSQSNKHHQSEVFNEVFSQNKP